MQHHPDCAVEFADAARWPLREHPHGSPATFGKASHLGERTTENDCPYDRHLVDEIRVVNGLAWDHDLIKIDPEKNAHLTIYAAQDTGVFAPVLIIDLLAK